MLVECTDFSVRGREKTSVLVYWKRLPTKTNGIAKYIREQEKEDIIYDQLAIKEYADPFKG